MFFWIFISMKAFSSQKHDIFRHELLDYCKINNLCFLHVLNALDSKYLIIKFSLLKYSFFVYENFTFIIDDH